ncbi:amidohydrolase [Desulforhopalus singaporensis]|uniref:amidohydrolase n=1 Tax=Desulforhopalus singaporensis TaxID=91360 RepID=UPI001C40A1BE|nr:amidohydrolase [Desulforhopalus singaporensis]
MENAVRIRKELHQIPEPAWEEFGTASFIQTQLDAMGVSWKRCTETGIVASIAPQKKGEHLGFRADMDGLRLHEQNDAWYRSTHPQVMHGCGHDGHMAVLLAVVNWLNRHQDRLEGPVTFIFQPAEEGGHGAREMIKHGALEGVDRIFGWHNWPAIPLGSGVCPEGPLMAANGSFVIRVKGSGGHASQPELCRDPVLAGAAITLALQQIVSRNLSPQTPGVVSVTSFDGRSGATIIPEAVTLQGSVRLGAEGEMGKIGKAIESIATSIAAGYNTSAEVKFTPRYPAVINSRDEARRFAGCLAEGFGEHYFRSEIELPIMASEDFSYYLAEIPGAFALIGAGDGGRYSVPCHNSCYDFNDRLIEPMVRTLCLLAGVSF